MVDWKKEIANIKGVGLDGIAEIHKETFKPRGWLEPDFMFRPRLTQHLEVIDEVLARRDEDVKEHLQGKVAIDASDFKALLKLAERTVLYNVEHDRLTRNGAYEDTKEMVALLERMKDLK